MAEDAAATGAARRERLAQRRKALGLTQDALAGLLGVERSTVVRWERGETEPLPWMRGKLAVALRVSASQLAELLDNTGPDRTLARRTARGSGAPPAVPRQLPAAVGDFTGRAAELETLSRILDDNANGPPGTVVISAIGGAAGVGKTALAVRWAHQVAGRFGDGQLYVNLRGFDPCGIPMTAAEAIRGFLDALGVPPGRIPPQPDAQAGMYRSLMVAKKMLIVLDNARDEQQVRPLLPASPGSLVIVTSRNRLTGLAAAEGARLLSLDVLAPGEAIELLAARIGASRAAAEPDAVSEIAAQCAFLPLALAVAAARATARPAFPLSTLAAELGNRARRLDALDAGDPAASVRGVFSWSYQQLSAAAARMFRLLGLHPGPDISVPAAASLAATGAAEARRSLGELTRAHLIAERVPGRYAFHDLLRAYAAAQGRDIDSDNDRAAATARLLDYYLHTAYAADMVTAPWRTPITLAPLSAGVLPEPHADHQQAMAWFEAEHDVLFAAVPAAAQSGFDRQAWQLPAAMAIYLQRSGRLHERAGILDAGLAAATRLGDVAGQAACHRLLASACLPVHDYERADTHVRRAMELYRRLGDHRGEARTHALRGSIAAAQARYADAVAHAERAQRLYQAIGQTAGEAEMLNDIGFYYGHLGDYQQARAHCQRAVSVSAEIGDRHTEGYAWDSLAYAERHLGNLTAAAACYERALGIFRDFGDRHSEAVTLSNLGDVRHAADDPLGTRETWRQALAILDDLGHPDAGEVRAKLASLG
jgi:tetratricopeptide (TPR) repeat protein/transcriptional regulator with XRE-family HTH domain